MNSPNNPSRNNPSPEDRPQPGEREPTGEEAARLLEVGLDPVSGPGRTPPPGPAEVEAWFPNLEVIEVIGQGGMGVVYKARQKALDRLVALKVLPEALSQDPAFSERFTREARTLARLHHPHIVGVHEFGDIDGRYYLLMEYVDGVNLRQLMDTQALAPREALAIVPQICDALQYAHDQGVVHRDIKPENVLLDRAGRVKVADFGLAKLVQRGPSDFTLTGTGQVMGTVHYMAPEQYRTPQDVDHRADIFSLGVVFYEMLTGDLPVGRFQKPSEAASLDARLDEIVMKTLERERDLRYQHAGDVKSEITTLGDAEPRHQFGARHAARREARSSAHGARPLSRLALASVIAIPLVAPLGLVVYALVKQFSSGYVEEQRYIALISGYWTAIAGFVFAVVLALIAVVATGGTEARVRGRALAIVALITSFILVSFTASLANQQILAANRTRLALYNHVGSAPVPDLSVAIEVEGARSRESAFAIRSHVDATWRAYLSSVRDHDLGVGDAKELYSKKDWRELGTMTSDELKAQRARRALGLPQVGREHFPAPPWEFQITRIEVDPWERQARVTAEWSDGDAWCRLTIPMKRDGVRWVFAVVEVLKEEGARGSKPENR